MNAAELIEKAVQTINDRIRVSTQPIGIKLVKKGESLPDKVKRPSEMGSRWALCQAFFAARCNGWMMAIGAEDQACPVAQTLVGFEKVIPFYSEGNLALGMFAETMEAAKLCEDVVPKISFDEYKYVLIGPLVKFKTIVPNLVYIYGTPGQIARLIHGSLYKTGGNMASSFTGRAGCIATIAGCIQQNACQVVVNGNGERVFGHAQDNEMSFAIPWSKLENVIDGIEGTHKNGVRYPYPAFINYTPRFPSKYNQLEKMWKNQEDFS